MNEDLKWLAENVHEWPEGYESCDVEIIQREITASCCAFRRFRYGPSGRFNQYQWQAARDELSGKPSWDDVDGEWIAQDGDGHWYSFDNKPYHGNCCWYGNPFTRRRNHGYMEGSGKVLGDWRNTLERRPENHSVEPTEKVWRGPDDGLPPVRMVIEAWFDDGRRCWHKAHVVGYHPSEANTIAVSLIGDHESRLIWSDISGIRPIPTEEDKAVER